MIILFLYSITGCFNLVIKSRCSSLSYGWTTALCVDAKVSVSRTVFLITRLSFSIAFITQPLLFLFFFSWVVRWTKRLGWTGKVIQNNIDEDASAYCPHPHYTTTFILTLYHTTTQLILFLHSPTQVYNPQHIYHLSHRHITAIIFRKCHTSIRPYPYRQTSLTTTLLLLFPMLFYHHHVQHHHPAPHDH